MCLNHVARSLKSFEEIGSILGLDYIDEALRRHLKIPADDAFDIRAWSSVPVCGPSMQKVKDFSDSRAAQAEGHCGRACLF